MSPVLSRIGVLVACLAIFAGPLAVPASAAWQSTGSGTAYAKATRLGVPAPSIGAPSCSGLLSRTGTVSVTWNAVADATSYDLRWSLDPSMSSPTLVSPATNPTSVAIDLGLLGLASATVYVQVRAKRHSWIGEYTSPPKEQRVSC
jgi:hypothetical protein